LKGMIFFLFLHFSLPSWIMHHVFRLRFLSDDAVSWMLSCMMSLMMLLVLSDQSDDAV